VRFLLSEDRSGLFQLAPLQSPAFTRLVPLEERAELPDSMVLRGRNGQLLARARAAIEIGTALGGLWRAGATLWMIVPPELADRLYDFVAARRRQLFAPPAAACPLIPPRLRTRFVPDALPDDQPAESSAPR
jgi:predicted DCC family thiol-disulfide oxidoreductase YuxK